MKSDPRFLSVNGGSSSIKFALFEGAKLRRILEGKIEGIGLAKGIFKVNGMGISRSVKVRNHRMAAGILMEYLEDKIGIGTLAGVGHRIVHGGPNYWKPQRITPAVIRELRRLSPLDPEHLPEEILLTEVFQKKFPRLPQVACFDTAFHHDLPAVARILPIPRRYAAKGVRRYGFHGLSCAYLMEELARVAGAKQARGRVVLAHLGSGASLTAVCNENSIDTSMSFTPASGIPMSTRAGDLDPSLAWYLARQEKMTAAEFHRMINHESGLLGISGTSPDMRQLQAREKKDARAAEAVNVFCYQAKKWICAFAGALGGLETLVFAGGIGENAAPVRARICAGLDFLGLKLDAARNARGAAVISAPNSRVTVRVIRTDEELMIARSVLRLLNKH